MSLRSAWVTWDPISETNKQGKMMFYAVAEVQGKTEMTTESCGDFCTFILIFLVWGGNSLYKPATPEPELRTKRGNGLGLVTKNKCCNTHLPYPQKLHDNFVSSRIFSQNEFKADLQLPSYCWKCWTHPSSIRTSKPVLGALGAQIPNLISLTVHFLFSQSWANALAQSSWAILFTAAWEASMPTLYLQV